MYRLASVVFPLAVFGLLGCGAGGDDAGRQPVFTVTGTVTLNGSPLENATVAFAPQAGQPTAVGSTDAQGKFVLTTYEYGDGAAAGAFAVVINKTVAAPASTGAASSGGDHEATEQAGLAHDADSESAGVGMVPAQYTRAADTPLSADVKTSGENNFTFELS